MNQTQPLIERSFCKYCKLELLIQTDKDNCYHKTCLDTVETYNKLHAPTIEITRQDNIVKIDNKKEKRVFILFMIKRNFYVIKFISRADSECILEDGELLVINSPDKFDMRVIGISKISNNIRLDQFNTKNFAITGNIFRYTLETPLIIKRVELAKFR